jgi:hypothetical protein
MESQTETASRSAPRQTALIGLGLTVATVQFSIAVSQICLAVALAAWTITLVTERRRPSAPAWMLPLMLYAGWTFVSTAFSPDVVTSLTECKQLVLLLLVPLTYDIVDEDSAVMLTTIILVAGACSAVIGIGQYAFLHYDNLDQRARSTLGLYMTFSGLIMLVLNVALARVLFMTRSGMWPALLIPVLAVVLPLSFSRNAVVGACCAVAFPVVHNPRSRSSRNVAPGTGLKRYAVVLVKPREAQPSSRAECRATTVHDQVGVPHQ